MKFTKMHGIGNDYVYVNCFEETVKDPAAVAKFVSDRHFGIGSDGLILIRPSEIADCEMDMYNLDGSQGAMCGNGIRCVAKYVYDHGIVDKTSLSIATRSGIKYVDLTIRDGKASMVKVNMGSPILTAKEIPVVAETEQVINAPITVDGKEIKIYAKANAAELPWGELGVDVVLECTGFYTSKAKAQAHIDAGAKKVVISAPAGNDLPTIVFSVNENTLTADDKIISAASCTTNCLAPMAKALNDYAPIQSGIMSTIHAYTGDQMILDGPHRKGDYRRARAGAANIVPNSTGAAKAIGLVIPELNGKLIGSAQRVPVPTGSTTILTAVVKGADVTKEGINAAMKAAASASFGYNEDQIVSSDVIGMKYGSLFDATQTMVLPIDENTSEVQVVSWYDNENSYTSQMVRTIKHFGKLLNA